jgi:hypothetical protein
MNSTQFKAQLRSIGLSKAIFESITNTVYAHKQGCDHENIISRINDYWNSRDPQKTAKQHTSAIKALIKELLPNTPKPIKQIVNRTKEQRRHDSLARLLAPSESITPCVAIAVNGDSLVIASNEAKTATAQETLRALLQARFDAITSCLAELHTLSSTQKQKRTALIDALITTLNNPTLGGFSLQALPQAAGERAVKAKDIKTHMKRIIKKLSALYETTDGSEPLTALVNALQHKKTILLVPLHGDKPGTIHAEQALAEYFGIDTAAIAGKNFGISKLCCTVCAKTLSTTGATYRGDHGITFPNVYSLVDNTVSTEADCQTLMNGCMVDIDSHSETTITPSFTPPFTPPLTSQAAPKISPTKRPHSDLDQDLSLDGNPSFSSPTKRQHMANSSSTTQQHTTRFFVPSPPMSPTPSIMPVPKESPTRLRLARAVATLGLYQTPPNFLDCAEQEMDTSNAQCNASSIENAAKSEFFPM